MFQELDFTKDTLWSAWEKTYHNLAYFKALMDEVQGASFHFEFSSFITTEETDNAVIGVEGYSPQLDLLLVHVNGTYQHNEVDYTIHPDALRIVKVGGTWEEDTKIEFVVIKTVQEGITGVVDGGNIIAGTIMESALNEEYTNSLVRRSELEALEQRVLALEGGD